MALSCGVVALAQLKLAAWAAEAKTRTGTKASVCTTTSSLCHVEAEQPIELQSSIHPFSPYDLAALRLLMACTCESIV